MYKRTITVAAGALASESDVWPEFNCVLKIVAHSVPLSGRDKYNRHFVMHFIVISDYLQEQ